MVSQGAVAYAFSFFPTHAAATVESDHHVGPVVLCEFRLCGDVRCSCYLFLRLAWVSLSCVRVFLFDWVASGGRALDSRALHLRFRPGDVQLLRADQSCSAEHGLSQRAPRFAFHPLEQPAEATRDGAGILRQLEISFVMGAAALPIRF